MPPLESVETYLNLATRKLTDYRERTQALMHRVHRSDLVYEFFFVFSRFEHALLVTSYLAERNGAVVADWDKFAREVNEAFNLTLPSEVEKASITKNFPPKKQVVELGKLTVKDVVPETGERLEKLLVLVRRVRNNLFHGEKFRCTIGRESSARH